MLFCTGWFLAENKQFIEQDKRRYDEQYAHAEASGHDVERGTVSYTGTDCYTRVYDEGQVYDKEPEEQCSKRHQRNCERYTVCAAGLGYDRHKDACNQDARYCDASG